MEFGLFLLVIFVLLPLSIIGIPLLVLGIFSGRILAEQVYYFQKTRQVKKRIILPLLSVCLAIVLFLTSENQEFFQQLPISDNSPLGMLLFFPIVLSSILLRILIFFFLLGVVSHVIGRNISNKKKNPKEKGRRN